MKLFKNFLILVVLSNFAASTIFAADQKSRMIKRAVVDVSEEECHYSDRYYENIPHFHVAYYFATEVTQEQYWLEENGVVVPSSLHISDPVYVLVRRDYARDQANYSKEDVIQACEAARSAERTVAEMNR